MQYYIFFNQINPAKKSIIQTNPKISNISVYV